jgi:prepilin-type N-terminal cleavage/methylation domain-containing protein
MPFIMIQPRSKQKGFTLFELLLVILIIGILTGSSLPAFKRAVSAMQLESFSRQLLAFMNYTHERAIAEGEVIYFNIDAGALKYWAHLNSDSAGADKTYQIPKGIDVKVSDEVIPFYPDGNMGAANIILSSPGNKPVVLVSKGACGGIGIQAE